MTSIVALGAVTVGINLSTSSVELNELGITSGSYNIYPIEQMEELRLKLESNHGTLPKPHSGGSISNTASLLARANLTCGLIGIGGNDTFGRAFVSDCEKSSLKFLSKLEDDAVTGYDFYLVDDNDVRTIVWSAGANALLNPTKIDVEAIQNAELLLIDGSALSYGPESEAALVHCINVAEEAGVPFVLTLSSSRIVNDYRGFFESFAPKAQMVAGNLEQVGVLVRLEPTSTLEEVRLELAKTPINAIVTLDADGAFAKFGNEEILVPTEKVKAIDSTGAGDAFLAAFIIARKKGLSTLKALTVGNIIASKVIQYKNARLPLSTDIPQLIQHAIQMAERINNA